MKIENGWLIAEEGDPKVDHIPTHKMSGEIDPEFIVWHYTVGSAASAISVFTKGSRQVSAHLLIHKDGTITQFVPFNRKAWHAGRSSWEGRPGCNSFTIGVELENVGPLTYGNRKYRDVYGREYDGGVVSEKVGRYEHWAAYTADQLESAQLAAEAMLDGMPRIRGMLEHSDIAPARKIDSGPAFPIEMFEGMVDDRGDRNSDEEDTFKVTVGLNMRDAGGMHGKVIAVLPRGTIVRVKQAVGMWWLLKVDEDEVADGWVYSKYLEVT